MNIKGLQERYGITRTPLYSRLRALDITLAKDSNNQSFATDEQVTALDQLDEHLKNGGNLKNFVPSQRVTVLSPTKREEEEGEGELILPDEWGEFTPSEKMLFALCDQLPKRFAQVTDAIADKVSANLKPHAKDESLVWYSENKIIIPSSKLRSLIGIKNLPKSDFERGSFKFIKQGKIGAQGAWQVVKI